MLISIVVPVYNAQNTLGKCINSILSQDYSKFEVILINDGSEDGSLELCQGYKMNPKVKIINQQNSGVSSARNKGIENSRGDYICFVDADDWIENDYLSLFVNEYVNLSTLLIQDIYRVTIDSIELNANYKGGIFKINDLETILVENNLLRYGFPFAKFYSKEIIERYKLRFAEEIQYGEDLIFFISYLNHIEKIKFIPKARYHYIISVADTSLSKKYSRFESEIIGFKKFVIACNKGFLNPKNTKEYDLILNARKGLFLTRAVESLYRDGTKKCRPSRISILKELSGFEKNRIYFSDGNQSGFRKYPAYFFRNKKITFLDFSYRIMFYFRYLLNGIWLLCRKRYNKKLKS